MLSVSKLLDLKIQGAQNDIENTRYSRTSPPVVVWNITKRCDLHCVHCYNDSAMKDYPGELTTGEAKKAIDDLSGFRVPALIFSGGDPLLREDFFELASYSRQKGIRPILSTSGVNIDEDIAKKIKESGIVYAGVSLDGGEAANDRLRGVKGAYKRALQGL
ncbi:MAG: radical SAM protein, partial [Deltaproteobacteria bacterium]|nr:radical SAM protein [Deltaproteobacteria bacterium]